MAGPRVNRAPTVTVASTVFGFLPGSALALDGLHASGQHQRGQIAPVAAGTEYREVRGGGEEGDAGTGGRELVALRRAGGHQGQQRTESGGAEEEARSCGHQGLRNALPARQPGRIVPGASLRDNSPCMPGNAVARPEHRPGTCGGAGWPQPRRADSTLSRGAATLAA